MILAKTAETDLLHGPAAASSAAQGAAHAAGQQGQSFEAAFDSALAAHGQAAEAAHGRPASGPAAHQTAHAGAAHAEAAVESLASGATAGQLAAATPGAPHVAANGGATGADVAHTESRGPATSAAPARSDKSGKPAAKEVDAKSGAKDASKEKAGKGGKKARVAVRSGLAAALQAAAPVSNLGILAPLARAKHSAAVVAEAAKAKAMKAVDAHLPEAQAATPSGAAVKAPQIAVAGFEKTLAAADVKAPAAAAPVAKTPELPDDDSLRLMLMPQGATLSLQTDQFGPLRLRINVTDGVADVKIRSADAANLQLQTGALRTELAAHGLRLGAYEVAAPDAGHAAAGQNSSSGGNASAGFDQAERRGQGAPQDTDRDLPSSNSNHRPARPNARHAGRIDVEA